MLPLVGDRHRFVGMRASNALIDYDELMKGLQAAEEGYKKDPRKEAEMRYLHLRKEVEEAAAEKAARSRPSPTALVQLPSSAATSTAPSAVVSAVPSPRGRAVDVTEEQEQPAEFSAPRRKRVWKCHFSAEDIGQRLSRLWQKWGEIDEAFVALAVEVVRLYAADSFLSRSLDEALLSHSMHGAFDALSPTWHLAPYAGLLQRSILALAMSHPWRGECYKTQRLSDEWLSRLQTSEDKVLQMPAEAIENSWNSRGIRRRPARHGRGPSQPRFSLGRIHCWDGVVIAQRSIEAAWNEMIRTRANCLFILRPDLMEDVMGRGTHGYTACNCPKCGGFDPRTLVGHVPADLAPLFPDIAGESRVLYPLGQHFERRAVYRLSLSKLRELLLRDAEERAEAEKRQHQRPNSMAPSLVMPVASLELPSDSTLCSQPITVVELHARDLFWELSADLFDDDGPEAETAQALKHRIRLDAFWRTDGQGVQARTRSGEQTGKVFKLGRAASAQLRAASREQRKTWLKLATSIFSEPSASCGRRQR
eukprot:gnl/TRDRNA2_/TRDRNA2_146645_c2_seq1.p1 gnl/TRDRNA2_/TRDRNA2_146645_c2~~gnl/TRDRNA2_/TRDRNA2_146645_c2_seq1.p1  ORF type:complete len:624 (-),score=97.62 gnl/TRDRNA2_/TRDRNA2_146645_c2_seq1:245-1849(-)